MMFQRPSIWPNFREQRMAFDWEHFFDQYGIEYVKTGPNVARGDVNIKCPFCGSADPSHHMGVSVDGRGWSCWRNRHEHSGKSAVRLVIALLGCSAERARVIVGTSAPVLDESFLGSIQSSLSDEDADEHREERSLELMDEFKPFRDVPSAKIFINYLKGRNFTLQQILALTEDYDLHYATRGPFKGRIIFPIYHRRRLVNWTGRSVYPGVDLRYKTLPTEYEAALDGGVPQAAASIGQHILWYDDLMRIDCDTLVLVEGPFDALKVNVLGYSEGICSTCFFTATPSDAQIDIFHDLLPRFKRRFFIPDEGAEAMSLTTAARLRTLDVETRYLTKGVKDPGDFRKVSDLNKVLGS